MSDSTVVINKDLSFQGRWNVWLFEPLPAWAISAINRDDLVPVTSRHPDRAGWKVKTADGVVLASVGDRIENHDGILSVKGAKQ